MLNKNDSHEADTNHFRRYMNYENKESFESTLPYLTTRMELESYGKKYYSTGFFYDTGFVFNIDPNVSHKALLLISNKHCFLDREGRFDPEGSVSFFMNQMNDNTVDHGNTISCTINFDDDNPFPRYFPHPHSEVDLACVNVSMFRNAYLKCMGADMLDPIDDNEVLIGENVIFVGYPSGYYDEVNNLPFIRSGSIASIPNIDYRGRGEIVIDAQIFPGSSGSPVFVYDRLMGKAKFLGVVSQMMCRESELELQGISANIREFIREHIGLGIVIKQRHVSLLVNYAVGQIKQIIKCPEFYIDGKYRGPNR